MRNWIKWTSKYPNPVEVSRDKYYEYEIDKDTALVYGDGLIIDYTLDQLKELYSPETGSWEQILKPKAKDDKNKSDEKA